MKVYSFTDINKTPGEVLDEALKGPVSLTKRGKERLIILPAERFHQMMGRPTQEAYSIYDRSSPHYDELQEALEAESKASDSGPHS